MSDSGAIPPGGEPTEDFEDLYENAPCGYMSTLPDGSIYKVNKTFAAWLGVPPEYFIGKPLHDLLNIAGRIFYETHFAPLLRMQGSFDEVALDLVTPSGARLPVLVNARERRDAKGKHLFTRLTIFNATDRRRYERELVEARAAAENANQRLSASLNNEREIGKFREQFVALLGHDLRNPLASIAGGLRLQGKTPLSERAAALNEMMLQSVARMSDLIDDVLDFVRGRLGNGIGVMRNADQPLQPTLRQVVAELQATFPDREILERYDLPFPIDCDRGRIGQLASNLLANALTYGAADMPIALTASIQENMFELSVSNAGDPIPPEILEHLFEPFDRGAAKPSKQGLGLGLYIASEIAHAHGGTLKATSSDQETRFTFQMPV